MTETKAKSEQSQPVKDTWEDLDPARESNSGLRTESIVLPMIQGLKVLVVGENKKRRDLLARALKKHQVQAFATTPDEHGYRAALKFHPDVAISEVAKPGDPGWWLVKRFHRHPALKWTPALLMKWWQEKNGKEIIQMENVFERLGEALTPIRLLEERIDAGRKLNDRVETTGMQSVISVLSIAGISGTLSVNDSWNIFEVDMVNGSVRSIVRKGVDGKEDLGHPAFLQLLLTDSGHWTFRTHDSAPRPKNVFLPIDGLYEWARGKLNLLFGPDVRMENSQLLDNLHVDRSMFHDVASTFTGLGRDLLEGIAAGASESELNTIVGDKKERIDAEQAMISLVRCGAIHLKERGNQLSNDELKAAKRVAYVLDWIAKDHQTEEQPAISDSVPAKKKTTGFYSFSNVSTDQVAKEAQKYTARKDRSDTVDLSTEDSWDPEKELEESDVSWRRQFGDEPEKRISKFLGVTPHDSLAPGPSPEERSKLQMWVAIVIAVLLGALLISGLVIIGSNNTQVDDYDADPDR
ncbi:MAG: hypothetical protein JXX29_05655 [Deltaproteobacteria bacterium]|nr:hypothetical protein [Deltaproteobacteria bacterium]MBN2671134.1 hypothetical protein [Deltaproteobacteria bacterium]